MNKNQEMIEALYNLMSSFDEVSEQWHSVDLNKTKSISIYPFEKSLDELSQDVSNWCECTISELRTQTAKIVDKRYINTGGGNYLLELLIEDGGDLKSICINDEIICGYNRPFEECQDETAVLWSASGYASLTYRVQLEIAFEVIRCYREYIEKHNCSNTLGL